METKGKYNRWSYYVRCQVCGTKVRAKKTFIRWDNLVVDKPCYEERNPQDFLKGVKDDASPPDKRFVTGDLEIDGGSDFPSEDDIIPRN